MTLYLMAILATIVALAATVPMPIVAYRALILEGPTLFNVAWGVGATSFALLSWLSILYFWCEALR